MFNPVALPPLFAKSQPSSRLQAIVLCLFVITICGCVRQSTYQAVQTEIHEVKTALVRTSEEVDQLTAQKTQLETTNKQEEQAVLELLDRLQNEKDADALWQKRAKERTDALAAKLNALQQQRRWLTHGNDQAVKEQEKLEGLVAKYKSELENSVISPEPVVTPSPRDLDLTAGPSTGISPPGPITPPVVSPPTPPPPPQPEPITPPVRQQPRPEPEEESWLSTVKGWLGSIWRMIFS